jgi:hypothetical protein
MTQAVVSQPKYRLKSVNPPHHHHPILYYTRRYVSKVSADYGHFPKQNKDEVGGKDKKK